MNLDVQEPLCQARTAELCDAILRSVPGKVPAERSPDRTVTGARQKTSEKSGQKDR